METEAERVGAQIDVYFNNNNNNNKGEDDKQNLVIERSAERQVQAEKKKGNISGSGNSRSGVYGSTEGGGENSALWFKRA